MPVLLRSIVYAIWSPAEWPMSPMSGIVHAAVADNSPFLCRISVTVDVFTMNPPDAGSPLRLREWKRGKIRAMQRNDISVRTLSAACTSVNISLSSFYISDMAFPNHRHERSHLVVLLTEPRSMSAWLRVYVAVQTNDVSTSQGLGMSPPQSRL